VPDAGRYCNRFAGRKQTRRLLADLDPSLALDYLEPLRPITVHMGRGLAAVWPQESFDHRSLGGHLDHADGRPSVWACPFLAGNQHACTLPNAPDPGTARCLRHVPPPRLEARRQTDHRRRQTEHGSGPGRHRWVVERTFAWLHNRRRLLIRIDRRDDIHEGFLALACCLICWRRLQISLS